MKDTLKLRYKVDPGEITFIDMIIKAYEGVGKLNVDHDAPDAPTEIWIDVTEGTKAEVKEIMADLGQKFKVEYISEE